MWCDCNQNIPDNSITVGVPARVIEDVKAYIKKHQDDFVHTKSMSADEKRTLLEDKYLKKC